MSNSSKGILQADGTLCRKGSACQRHGMTKKLTSSSSSMSPAEQILKQIKEVKKVQKATPVHPLFPVGNVIRKGLNNPSDTATLDALDIEANNFRAELSNDEYDAIAKYSMTAYDYVNSYLREGNAGLVKYLKHSERIENPSQGAIDEHIRYAEKIIPHLDSAFAKEDSVVKEERLLYKAFRVKTPNGSKTTSADITNYVEENYPIGKTITSKAYVSTSVDADYMLAFSRRQPEEVIVHEIVSKKGIPLHESDWRRGDRLNDAEREILLARGTKFKVVGIKKATFESTYPGGRPTFSPYFITAPKKKRYTVIQMVEEE
jgi:hypothetical protein